MFGLLADQGVASLPWCPLAKGYLARPYGRHTPRSAADTMGRRFFGDSDRPIIDAVENVAHAHGVPMARIALAWILNQPLVAAPVLGATNPRHLDDAAAALDIRLSDDEHIALTAGYTPREPTGY